MDQQQDQSIELLDAWCTNRRRQRSIRAIVDRLRHHSAGAPVQHRD